MKTQLQSIKNRSLALALVGALTAFSSTQNADAILIFNIVDADTFTLTADGGSLQGGFDYYSWGNVSSFQDRITVNKAAPRQNAYSGNFPDSNSEGPGNSNLYATGSLVDGLSLQTDPFGGGPITLADGETITVSNVREVDLNTLTLPELPLTFNGGENRTNIGISATGAPGTTLSNNVPGYTGNINLAFNVQAVPEPSSSMIFALGMTAIMLRRRRKSLP